MAFGDYNQFTGSYRTWDDHGFNTPDVEESTGLRPDAFTVAPWLPGIRYHRHFRVYAAITTGTPLALDLDGNLVPAGLTTITYTTADIGVVYSLRTGARVAQADIDFGPLTVAAYTKISPMHIGIAPYDIFCWYGGTTVTERDDHTFSFFADPTNVLDTPYTDFGIQPTVAILTDWYIKVPWLGTTTAGFTSNALSYIYAIGALATNSSFGDGLSSGVFYPGCFVCTSGGKYVPYDSDSHATKDIVGQLLKIDSDFPKNYLERVRVAQLPEWGTMDQMPGTPTRGMPYDIHITTDGAYRTAVDAGSTPGVETHTRFKINLIGR